MTLSQLETIRAARLQLLDHGFLRAAARLDWAVTAEADDWISVRDRMPPDGDEVLVLVDYDDGSGPYVMVDRWAMRREDPLGMGGPTIEIGFDWDNNAPDDVSHWRPMPLPSVSS